MVHHVGENAVNVMVGQGIEDVPAVARRAHYSRCPQEPEVVANEGGRQPGVYGDFAHWDWPLSALDEDAQAARIAEQPKDFSELIQLVH